jgi:RND family efflux transporter MFP subunit
MADELSRDLTSLKIDRSSAPRTRGWLKPVLWLGVLGALVAAALVSQPMVEAKLFKTPVSATEIALVSPAEASIQLTATGYVQADVASRVAPKVPGRVIEVHVRQGERVEPGQILLELDPADDRAAIKAALSEVVAARAQAQSARARALVSKSELAEAQQQAERERKLAVLGASAASIADDLEARVASLRQTLGAAEAEAKAMDAQANALGAQVGVLQTGLGNLVLKAPIAGTIINKPPQVGEYVGPQPPGVTVDMGGIRVADFSTLLVETDIPEARLSQVKQEAPTEIVLEAYPTRRYRGAVKEITPQVDRAKATVIVKVRFVDEPKGVLPDMSARVSFLAKALDAEALKAAPKTVVPGVALGTRAGVKVVFQIDAGKVRMQPVKLGAPFGSGFELIEGPPPGTQVVANPPDSLSDGQNIKIEK